jgi:3-hydroxyisobutyrate dehydrogenase-like beta-hydroxyacid dehydrogenase
MSDVSVIGLGSMGSALARAMLRAGHRVTVWNRTAAKAAPLTSEGATMAASAATAVAASPVVIVCVDDYDVTRTILGVGDVVAALPGRTVVQLSTGSPQEARTAEAWVQERGAAYLDGAILAYPDEIGTPTAAIFVAGAPSTFQSVEPLLGALAGNVVHLGEQVGAASALDGAALSFVLGGLLGALHGARICEVEGLRVDVFGGMLGSFVPVLAGVLHDVGARIQENRFDDSHAALKTYATAAARLVRQARESRIDGEFPAFVDRVCRRGMAAGLGGEDIAALITLLRGAA